MSTLYTILIIDLILPCQSVAQKMMTLQRQISVDTEIVRNVPNPIDNIVKADVGMSWGYLFSFRMIIGYFGEKMKESEREIT